MKAIKICNLVILLAVLVLQCQNQSAKIDRKGLVQRHNPVITLADPLAPLSVGNGEFAFTADFTGLQTFEEYYNDGISLNTMSHWGWHTIPDEKNYQLEEATGYYDTYGRQVPYVAKTRNPAARWLRANPHRLHLGRIGLKIFKRDGSIVQVEDVKNIRQTLDMWTGLLTSSFEIEDTPVHVETAIHGQKDMVGVKIHSPLISNGQLKVEIAFPYGSERWGSSAADWTKPHRHKTVTLSTTDQRVDYKRVLDNDSYYVSLNWSRGGSLKNTKDHHYELTAQDSELLSFSCSFSEEEIQGDAPDVEQIQQSAASHWYTYWTDGGVIDLSQSTDPRAEELERRIVLSQYLLAINSSGSIPPQETGLTCNSWYGKFHLEMHWWHAVHFALGGKYELLEKSMPWYQNIMPMARSTAEMQGYKGVRWPKMVGPDGREGPSGVGVFLIWQQPHPIYYAELLYRIHPNPETLEKYKEIVFESAEFMADYAYWDESGQRYVLGPPIIPAQESHPPKTTKNPTYELAYWAFGLQIAQEWRERLGLERAEKWNHVIEHLSPLPLQDGLYVNAESQPETFTEAHARRDHPSLLAAYGMIPGPNADPEIMRKTLKKVMESWNWPSTWGWDFPLVAMTAARVGEPELALKALFLDEQKNRYLINGHNYQRDNLRIYLPGNGALLSAVAMMAAGWDGAPDIHAPGFPQDGSWTVRWEGLERMP